MVRSSNPSRRCVFEILNRLKINTLEASWSRTKVFCSGSKQICRLQKDFVSLNAVSTANVMKLFVKKNIFTNGYMIGSWQNVNANDAKAILTKLWSTFWTSNIGHPVDTKPRIPDKALTGVRGIHQNLAYRKKMFGIRSKHRNLVQRTFCPVYEVPVCPVYEVPMYETSFWPFRITDVRCTGTYCINIVNIFLR